MTVSTFLKQNKNDIKKKIYYLKISGAANVREWNMERASGYFSKKLSPNWRNFIEKSSGFT